MAVVSLALAVAAVLALPEPAAAALPAPAAAVDSTAEVHVRGVNLYVGDLSAVFGYVPPLDGLSPADAERARVRGHLLFVHDILAAVDTTGWPAARRAARATNLERLRAYARAGEFPHDDDHPDAFRPTFVDRAGTLCAVGALFAAERGRGAAERIAATQKYAFVAQIEDAELASWQQTSGLSVVELGLIQPSYSEPPDSASGHLWLPFGLLDRMHLAPARLSATSEVGSSNRYDTTSVTLHAQASSMCDCRIGGYGTLPMSIVVTPDPIGVAAAGAVIRPESRTALGTAELGIYGGKESWRGDQRIYRIGALLPTASREQGRLLASARVGDSVLELPRTAGVRISTSRVDGWETMGSWRARHAWRVDAGLDVAVEYANSVHDRIVHIMPRAGIGSMIANDYATVSFDTALSLDPFVDFAAQLRWSAGITGRLARRDGRGGWFQPSLTLATVRTPDGWGGTIALDLAAAIRPRGRY